MTYKYKSNWKPAIGMCLAFRLSIMKSLSKSVCSAVYSPLLIVASTSAITVPLVDITVGGGVDVIAAPKSDLGNFGDGTVLSWLTTDVVNYNSINSTTLPAPVTVAGQIGQTGGAGGNSITLNLTGTFDYLFFHWGGQGGGWAQAFYIGGLTGQFSFDNTTIGTGQNPCVGGLSFFSILWPQQRPRWWCDGCDAGPGADQPGTVARRIKK